MKTNNISTQEKTFWSFLKDNRIEIPIIQRDYAQGRKGKEILRKNFLADIKQHLEYESEMKLDFVYGSKENGNFNPLDGQQRLTTLWLLHWYIALKSGNLKNDAVKNRLGNFTYETRISSREFCEQLCKPENFTADEKVNIVAYIKNSTWFYSGWNQDPTIQSMLTMLAGTKDNNDGIEQVFKDVDYSRYWDRLIKPSCPIVFYYLPLNEFKLTDDLYIKMNARGEQLTSFENFKADLIGYIYRRANDNNDWRDLLDPKSGFPILMDTKWTDIFWKNKSIEFKDEQERIIMSHRIDEIYFAFINSFFWNELFIAKTADDKNILDIGNGKDTSSKENENPSYRYLNDSNSQYTGLDVYKYYNGEIPIGLFLKLKSILNRYSDFVEIKGGVIPECSWNEDFYFIPKYTKDEKGYNETITNNSEEKVLKVTVLSQVQRIVFFALCKYFSDCGDDNQESLNRWVRVVWNLVSGKDSNGNAQIRSVGAMRQCIELLAPLDSHNIYESLNKLNPEVYNKSELDKRFAEEIIKAKQILDSQNQLKAYRGIQNRCLTWEQVIIEAEKFAFFNGAIRFLYQNAQGSVDWSYFDWKFVNVRKMFDENGVTTVYRKNARLLKLFLTELGKTPKDDLWFGNGSNFWRYVLLSNEFSRSVHNILYKQRSTTTPSVRHWLRAARKRVQEYCTIPPRLAVRRILDRGGRLTALVGPCGTLLDINPHQLRRLYHTRKNYDFRWIQEDNLLSTLIDLQHDKNSTWHILSDWKGCSVLTKYTNRVSGKVNYPNQIVVLDGCRNLLLNSAAIEIKHECMVTGTRYFYGWDIDFKYKNKYFRWHGEPQNGKWEVYKMMSDWENKESCNPILVDSNTCQTDFLNYLDSLVK